MARGRVSLSRALPQRRGAPYISRCVASPRRSNSGNTASSHARVLQNSCGESDISWLNISHAWRWTWARRMTAWLGPAVMTISLLAGVSGGSGAVDTPASVGLSSTGSKARAATRCASALHMACSASERGSHSYRWRRVGSDDGAHAHHRPRRRRRCLSGGNCPGGGMRSSK